MAHNSLVRLLQSAFGAALEEDAQSRALYYEYCQSRRKFLKQIAITAGSLALTPSLLNLTSCNKNQNESIAIIGAGVAGLNAAYQLKKNNINAIIYEVSNRVGGRMFTMVNEFGKGVTTEVGGGVY